MVYTAIENPTAEQQALLVHAGPTRELFQTRDGVFLYENTAKRKYRCCMVCFKRMGGTHTVCKDIRCIGNQQQVPVQHAIPVAVAVPAIMEAIVSIPHAAKPLLIPELGEFDSDEENEFTDEASEDASEESAQLSESAQEESGEESSDDESDSDEGEDLDPEYLDLDDDTDRIAACRDLLGITCEADVDLIGLDRCHHAVQTILKQAYPESKITMVRDHIIKILKTRSIADVVKLFDDMELGTRREIESDTLIAVLLLIGPLYERIVSGRDEKYSILTGLGHNARKVKTESIYICIVDIREFVYDRNLRALSMYIICKLGESKDPDTRSDAHAKRHFRASKKNAHTLTFDPNMYAVFTGHSCMAEDMFKALMRFHLLLQPDDFVVGPLPNGQNDQSKEIFGMHLHLRESDIPGQGGLFKRLHDMNNPTSDQILELLKNRNCRAVFYEQAKKRVLGNQRVMCIMHEAALKNHHTFLAVGSQILKELGRYLNDECKMRSIATGIELNNANNELTTELMDAYRQIDELKSQLAALSTSN